MIEKQVPVYVKLDDEFRASPEPSAPPANCVESGRATWCNEATTDYLNMMVAWGRELKKKLDKVFDLQPRGEGK